MRDGLDFFEPTFDVYGLGTYVGNILVVVNVISIFFFQVVTFDRNEIIVLLQF